MDARVLQAIGSPGIQAQVAELLRLARGALDDLAQLDEGLYERFVQQRTAPLSPEAMTASLRWLWDDTFAGLLALLEHAKGLEAEAAATPTAVADDAIAGGGEFDLGELEGLGEPAPSPSSSGLDLGAGDIGSLLDGIDEQVSKNTDDRWARVRDRLASLAYGLRSQLADALGRRDAAMAASQANAVLSLLDDTQSSASEGVHAAINAVYEAFLPETDAHAIVPDYLTTLGRALLVRRGLAALAQTIEPHNASLQRDPTGSPDEALTAVRSAMSTFVGSVVCRAMRPADRWQMVEFERELVEDPAAVARTTCEGLVKYLESLSTVNQREVLLRHDERLLEELRESLASARQLLELSPRTAVELLERAARAAAELRGRLVTTDKLLDALVDPVATDAAARARRLEDLEAFLAASGG